MKAGDLEAALVRLDRSVALMHEAGKTWTAGRAVVAMVLIHLALGDAVAAHKAFHKWGGYCDSDQVSSVNANGISKFPYKPLANLFFFVRHSRPSPAGN